MGGAWLWVPALVAALWLLYECGLVAVQAKRAVTYIGSGRGLRARFTGCSGYVRRVLRVRESRTYRFVMDMQLQRGEVWAEVLAGDRCLLRLDGQHLQGEVLLARGRRYRLVIGYRSADGRHDLQYQ